jgi:hypothetical protein
MSIQFPGCKIEQYNLLSILLSLEIPWELHQRAHSLNFIIVRLWESYPYFPIWTVDASPREKSLYFTSIGIRLNDLCHNLNSILHDGSPMQIVF